MASELPEPSVDLDWLATALMREGRTDLSVVVRLVERMVRERGGADDRTWAARNLNSGWNQALYEFARRLQRLFRDGEL